ncbi:DUF106 domain-containing protein [archaeon]|jgi:uncharacterized membrane protein (DUF106 family)|nr:DUF106 domain-containing protein [archaeon]
MLDSIFNSMFGSMIEAHPTATLIFISFLLTLFVSVFYKIFTDQKLMKALKEEMKEIRSDLKKFAHDPEKTLQLQKISMQKSMEHMKHTMKPTLITMLPLLVVFSWLRKTFVDIELSFLWFNSWLWIYILTSIIFSIIIRKLLKVH